MVLSAVHSSGGPSSFPNIWGRATVKTRPRSYSVNLLVSLAIAAVFTLVSPPVCRADLGLYTQDDATRALGQTYLRTYAWSFFRRRCPAWRNTALLRGGRRLPAHCQHDLAVHQHGAEHLLIFGHGELPALGGAGRGGSSQRSCAGGVPAYLSTCFWPCGCGKSSGGCSSLGHPAGTPTLAKILLLPLLASEFFLWSLGRGDHSRHLRQHRHPGLRRYDDDHAHQCLMVERTVQVCQGGGHPYWQVAGHAGVTTAPTATPSG